VATLQQIRIRLEKTRTRLKDDIKRQKQTRIKLKLTIAGLHRIGNDGKIITNMDKI